MKKLHLLLIAIITSIGAFSSVVQVGKLYYEVSGTTAYVVKPTSGYMSSNISNLSIPSKITYNDKEYTVTAIHGRDIFNNCSTIVSVSMANTIREIPQSAFYACSRLATLTLSNSLTEIPSNAFGHCNLKTITIPNSVISIGEYAFGYNPYLTSVTLGNKTESIGETAFSSCGRLETIELPATVTSIGKQAFGECSTLVSLNIPDAVLELGEEVCIGCSSLTSISIPGGVKAIRRSAFANCTNLASVTLSEGLDTIAQYAFSSDALTSVIIPNSVTYIGQYAFRYNSNLTTITIGSGVLKIDNYAFQNCPLTSMYVYATTPPTVGTTPSTAYSTCTIYVPATSVDAYKAASWWKNFNIQALPTYTITWKQDNGSTINTTIVTHGQTPTHANPTKSATAEYTYTFSRWTPTIVAATANATYTATYTATKRKYIITWKQDDGTTIDQTSVEYGQTPTHADPAKPASAEYTYTFTGWDPALTIVTGNKTYTAVYSTESRLYSILGISNDDNLGHVSVAKTEFPYVGFTATEESSIKMIYGGTLAGALPTLEYSYNGKTWNSFALSTDYPVATGQTFYMRGSNPLGVSRRSDAYSYFVMTGSLEGSGDIMTLVDSTGCTKTAPHYCFYYLFRNCTSLTKAPKLTATTLQNACYAWMFMGCVNLHYVEVDFTSWKDGYDDYTPNWFYEASSSGTFVKPAALSIVNGTSNIPSGWMIVDKDTISGNTSAGTNVGIYEYETNVVLTAEPAEHSHFVQWNDGETTNPRAIVVTQDTILTAVFAADTYIIDIPDDDEMDGSIAIEGSPTYGNTITLTAIPNECYQFVRWSDNNTENPRSVTITGNASYSAVFEKITYTITWKQDDGTTIEETTVDCGTLPTHANPTKQSTAQYTYSFIGWIPAIVEASANATYTATYDSVVNQYTVTFNNYDGTQLQNGKLDYGATPAYNGETPQRLATAQYTYSFKGWKPEVVAVTGNAIYTAEFDSVVNQYTITYNNYDGTELQSGKLDYGVMPAYNGETPQRLATAQYTYSFKGWKPEVVIVTGNAIYTAEFDSVVNEYDVTFHANGNGTAPDGQHLAYGSKVTKPADLTETGWTFGGWFTESACINAWDFDNDIVEGNLDLYAKWSPNTNTKYFVLHWQQNLEGDGYTMYEGEVKTGTTGAQTAAEAKTYEGFVLAHNFEQTTIYANGSAKVDIYYNRIVYQVNFKVEGTIVQTDSLRYGATPKYNGSEPTKPADAQYTYTFAGWSPEVTPITGDVTYTAIFDAVVNQYTVTFLNEDGTILDSRKWDYGEVPTCEEPTKPATPKYTYTFAGWTPQVVAVVGDATYTAQFDASLIIYNITTEPATGEQHGSVDINGTACYEATVTLTATPEDGYYFVSWNDGVTDNPRQIVVVSDTTLYPIFAECEPITTSLTRTIYEGDSYRVGNEEFTTRGTYRVTLTAANGCDSVVVLRLNVIKLPTYNVRLEVNELMGSVAGAGTYKQGDAVTITATPKAKSYRFVHWFNAETGEKIMVNPYTFTVTEDVLLRAAFTRQAKAITIEYRAAPKRMIIDEEETYAIVTVEEKSAEINNISGETYYIYDASGKLISTSREDKQYVLPSGMYIIRIEDQAEKFIVP